ncbi:MAG: methylated-DNA--[protein]-cysteine S-methyltransferase [Bacteroidota bacterium]
MEQSHHYQVIAEAIRFIQKETTAQPDLEAVAAHVHLSKFHVQRLFKQWAGISPKAFLQVLTLEQAKAALRLGRSTLEAAYETGLSGNGRLHDLFVKLEACTPGEFRKRGNKLSLSIAQIDTPFGPLCSAETPRGITALSFEANLEAWQQQLKTDYPLATFMRNKGPYTAAVEQYVQTWNLPDQPIHLDLAGTPFQVQVWKALLTIPSAQHLSYQDLATQIGRPKASRAVGTAIGKNPVAYLIPCHRVIKANGLSGGYRWEPDRKQIINAFEYVKLD